MSANIFDLIGVNPHALRTRRDAAAEDRAPVDPAAYAHVTEEEAVAAALAAFEPPLVESGPGDAGEPLAFAPATSRASRRTTQHVAQGQREVIVPGVCLIWYTLVFGLLNMDPEELVHAQTPQTQRGWATSAGTVIGPLGEIALADHVDAAVVMEGPMAQQQRQFS